MKSCEHTDGHLQAVFIKKNCLVKGQNKKLLMMMAMNDIL